MLLDQSLNELVNPFLYIMIQHGRELLLPRVLASEFLNLAGQLEVQLEGVTAWGYIFKFEAGIKDHYNDDYWVESPNTNSKEILFRNLESVRKHIEQLPDYVHLLGFEIYVEIL